MLKVFCGTFLLLVSGEAPPLVRSPEQKPLLMPQTVGLYTHGALSGSRTQSDAVVFKMWRRQRLIVKVFVYSPPLYVSCAG